MLVVGQQFFVPGAFSIRILWRCARNVPGADDDYNVYNDDAADYNVYNDNAADYNVYNDLSSDHRVSNWTIFRYATQ